MKNITDEFGHWFSGFVDGEGHFGIDTNNRKIYQKTVFIIKLRRDDRAILEYIQKNLGFGYLYDLSPSGGKNAKPQTKFQIAAIPDCINLLTVFDAYSLRSKKCKDYEIWKQAVMLKNEHYYYGLMDPKVTKKLQELGKELKNVRRYVEIV